MNLLRHITVLTLLACAGTSVRLSAQSESGATLSGDVRDQSGTPIANATVSLKKEGGGTAIKANTDNAGHYSMSRLSSGTYTIEVTSPNFSTSRREGLKLAEGAKEEFSTAMALAALPQTITVEGQIS